MAHRTIISEPIPQSQSARLRGVLKDEAGQPIGNGQISTLRLTVYCLDEALTVINGISAENILNVGRGSLDSNGVLIVTLGAADNPVLDDALDNELHMALLQWTWDGGTKAGLHEIEFPVANIEKVS